MSTSKQMKYIDSAGKETIVDIAVNAANVENNTFSQAAARTNIASGETLPGIFGKLAKWFTDLKAVAWSGKYSDLTDRPALGAAAAHSVANNCGTTAANFVLDARQGQVLQANINQVNSNLSASINAVSGSLTANVNAITGAWLGNNKISFDGNYFYATAANGVKKKLGSINNKITHLNANYRIESRSYDYNGNKFKTMNDYIFDIKSVYADYTSLTIDNFYFCIIKSKVTHYIDGGQNIPNPSEFATIKIYDPASGTLRIKNVNGSSRESPSWITLEINEFELIII